MKVFYWIRISLKRWLAKHFLITEYCKECGIKQPLVWYTSDETWFKVTGSKHGVLCPRCFDLKSKKLLMWWAFEDGKNPPITNEG